MPSADIIASRIDDARHLLFHAAKLCSTKQAARYNEELGAKASAMVLAVAEFRNALEAAEDAQNGRERSRAISRSRDREKFPWPGDPDWPRLSRPDGCDPDPADSQS